MHSRLVLILLVGLAASAYALDLSHAQKRSIESDPRILGFLNDFYATVVHPPLNHVVTNLALLGAQFLAGVSQVGIPLPGGGRNMHPTDAELRGFFDDLWNSALKPPLENALSSVSLMAAQVLAGVGTNGVNLSSLFGKRDLSEFAGRVDELRGFFDTLGQGVLNGLQSVWSNVLQNPVEQALSSASLMAAQVLAGLGTNGVNLSGLLGRRDLTEAEMRGFFDALTDALNSVYTNVLQQPLENALTSGALMAAQVLAGLGTNGVNLSGIFGKRDLTEAEMRGFFDALTDAFNSVFTNVLQQPIENALTSASLMAAQVLAGLGTNGVNLSGLLGKRDLTEAEMRGFFDALTDAFSSVFTNVLQQPLENALASASLMAAQVLAGLGTNGVNLSGLLGKRDLTEAEMRGFFDALGDAFSSVFTNVLQQPLENALASASLMAAQVLAGLGTNGVNLSGLLGKRDLTEAEMRGIFDAIGDAFNSVFTNVLQQPLENALASASLMAAQVLAGLGTNGVNLSGLFGKREARGVFSDLAAHANMLVQTQVKPIVENGLNAAALHLAGVLANFSQNGFGRR